MWPDPGDPGNGWPAATLAWLHALGLPRAVDLVVVEAAANVAMFVPLGVLLLVATRLRPAVAVVVGAAFSGLIELTQLTLLPQRVPTVQDVVMNTLGAVVGAAVVVALRTRPAPDPATDRAPDAEAAD